MNFSGILIGVLTFFSDWIVPSYCYICVSITLEAAVGRYFCWWAFVYDSIQRM